MAPRRRRVATYLHSDSKEPKLAHPVRRSATTGDRLRRWPRSSTARSGQAFRQSSLCRCRTRGMIVLNAGGVGAVHRRRCQRGIWQRLQLPDGGAAVGVVGRRRCALIGEVYRFRRARTRLTRSSCAVRARCNAARWLNRTRGGLLKRRAGGRGDRGRLPGELCRRVAPPATMPDAPRRLPEEASSGRPARRNGRVSGFPPGAPDGAGRRWGSVASAISAWQGRDPSIDESEQASRSRLLLRSWYKSGRWNCLQRLAMTPVATARVTGKSGGRRPAPAPTCSGA